MAHARVTVSGAPVGRRSTGRAAVLGAGLWLGVTWLACGGTSKEGLESPLPTVSLSSAGAGGTSNDAGSIADAGSNTDAGVDAGTGPAASSGASR
jgi:hypothetical protein